MKKESKILSIYIPTYKREKYLKQCIESIIVQNNDIRIPIIISNNEKNKRIESLINSYKSYYKYIYYFENKYNIGMDRNILNLFNYIHSKYCLMLGDDDIILGNKLYYLINLLYNKNYDFLLLNALNYDSKMLRVRSKHLEIKHNKVIKNHNSYFIDYWNKMPFSTLIINKEIAQKINYNRYIGTNHLYSAIPLETFICEKANKKALIVSNPIIGIRNGEKTWKNEKFEVSYIQIPNWFNSLDKKYFQVSQKIKEAYFENIIKLHSIIFNTNAKEINYYKLKELNSIYKINNIKTIKSVLMIPEFVREVIIYILKLIIRLKYDYIKFLNIRSEKT